MGCCLSTETEIDPVTPPFKDEEGEEIVDNLPQGIQLTGALKLRDEGFTGKGLKIAVIDSGIFDEHPGFEGKVTRKKWFREGPDILHGTHVAGTIHMMAPDADLYDYRVFGATGATGVTRAIAESIRMATDAGCKLINMSLGGPSPTRPIKEAIDYAYAKGVILVCAAGNEGDNKIDTNEISYPAYYSECISVAAVSKKDGFPVARFSNSNVEMDYSGIGVDAVSFKPGGGVRKLSGTSMACPHVCGFLACILQKHGVDTSDKELRKILNENYAIDIGLEGTDNATGIGFLSYLDESAFDAILPRKAMTPAQTE